MERERELEVKLPLMGKSIELEALPGQDPAERYGVIWDSCDQPGDGLGYVVRYETPRSCHVLAWMSRGAVVHECDRPISFILPGAPALIVQHADEDARGQVRVRLHGSDELVAATGFHDCFPNQVEFEPLPPGKGVSGATTEDELARAIGPYAGRRLGWRTFVAVSYLAFFLLPRCGAGPRSSSGTISDVLRTFVERPLPDAVDTVIFHVLEGQVGQKAASGFERYAARMLQQAGSAELRDVAARHRIGIARLSSTALFWIRFGEGVPPEDRAVLLSVESCLNRLALIERRLVEAGESTALADVRESVCAMHDRHILAGIADDARAHVNECVEENPYRSYLPAHSLRGGEWDVRTRFLRACEALSLPFRLEYRFDGDAAIGVLDVRFGLPPARAFPRNRWDSTHSRWESCADEVASQAACYALRLGALLASCAFGTSVGMREAVVTGCAESPDGQALMSLRFSRMSFLNRALYRIESGTVARVGRHGSGPADVDSLLALLAPDEARVRIGEDGGLLPLEPLQAALPASRLPISNDRRDLPPTLAHLLHASRVSDLDGEANTDLHELDEVHEAVEDARESRLLAFARLEELADRQPIRGLPSTAPGDVVAAAEAAIHGETGVPGYEAVGEDGVAHAVRLAYFPNLMTRCLVGCIARDDDEVFEPVPAAAYLSRSALVKLYAESGDVEAAVNRARECALLAPTSAGLLLELAQTMLAVQRPEEAIAFLRQALSVCVRQQMAVLLYAHLGGAYWMAGRQAQALAAFTLARGGEQGSGAFDQAIVHLVRQLGLNEMPGTDEAVATLRAEGIAPAPGERARFDVVNASVGFTDARMFELAWPLVGAVGLDIGNDVMAMMGEHLRRGLEY